MPLRETMACLTWWFTDMNYNIQEIFWNTQIWSTLFLFTFHLRTKDERKGTNTYWTTQICQGLC